MIGIGGSLVMFAGVRHRLGEICAVLRDSDRSVKQGAPRDVPGSLTAGSDSCSDMRIADVDGGENECHRKCLDSKAGVFLACPLIKDTKLRAIKALHQTRNYDWTPDEITLLQEVRGTCRNCIERALENFDLLTSKVRAGMMLCSELGSATVLLDANGCVTDWNAGAEIILGWKSDEIIGKYFSCFYTPEDIEDGQPDRELREAAVNGLSAAEGWRIRKTGARFWADVTLSPRYDTNHHLDGFASGFYDITNRKREEDKIRASLQKLNELKKIRGRTADVA